MTETPKMFRVYSIVPRAYDPAVHKEEEEAKQAAAKKPKAKVAA